MCGSESGCARQGCGSRRCALFAAWRRNRSHIAFGGVQLGCAIGQQRTFLAGQRSCICQLARWSVVSSCARRARYASNMSCSLSRTFLLQSSLLGFRMWKHVSMVEWCSGLTGLALTMTAGTCAALVVAFGMVRRTCETKALHCLGQSKAISGLSCTLSWRRLRLSLVRWRSERTASMSLMAFAVTKGGACSGGAATTLTCGSLSRRSWPCEVTKSESPRSRATPRTRMLRLVRFAS